MRWSTEPVLHFVTGRRSAWLVLVLAVVASGLVLGAGGSLRVSNFPTAGLPSSAQSTQVARLLDRLPSAQVDPALVVYSSTARALDEETLAAIAAQAPTLRESTGGVPVSPPSLSPDRTVALVVVPLPADVPDEVTSSSVAAVREVVRSGLPEGVRAEVTGPAGFAADLSAAFEGADVRLLAVTASVVALLLLLTYRSPILWLVPLVVVGVGDRVAASLVAILSRTTDLVIDQSVTGIVSVLVFGAGTNYALLLIARYREELRREPDRREAMRRALSAAGGAIAASACTVILALLTLVFAVLGTDRAIGVSGALGIAVALLFGLVVLPAALVVCPRGVFWPLVPRAGAEGAAANARAGAVWRRIGTATARRPRTVLVLAGLLLAALATGLTTTSLGLSRADTFRTEAESIDGLETLARAFPAGAADPTVVVTRTSAVDTVVDAARRVPGVAAVRPGESGDGITQIDVVLAAAPGTAASDEAIGALRSAVGEVPAADALVGGPVATELDTKNAALRDVAVVAPLILLVVLGVLVVLLRALVAPLVLLTTVVLSFFAALGGASFLFTGLLDLPGLDNTVPLLSFLFLVALGVDYNIFLVTRTREEASRVGTRRGVVDALAATGGVITSAGILLAAVFAVLGVLPVIVLTQIGVVVGLGVLLDTLLVRTVVVPAAVTLLGRSFWAPGRRPDDDADRPAEPSPEEMAPAEASRA